MNNKVIISSIAEQELTKAFNWYETCASGLGSDFLLSVDASINFIARHPEHYQIIYKTIRCAFTKRFPYKILFITKPNKIIVIAVFHAKRNPKNWKSRI